MRDSERQKCACKACWTAHTCDYWRSGYDRDGYACVVCSSEVSRHLLHSTHIKVRRCGMHSWADCRLLWCRQLTGVVKSC